MEYATFRKWLTEHGCRFDTQSEKRGEGHGTVTIHRAGRTAELPLVGARQDLDPSSVRQVCEALGLDWSKLPDRRAASDANSVGAVSFIILKAQAQCPLLAQSGHGLLHRTCPLSGVKQTRPFAVAIGGKADMTCCTAYVCF